jgi:cytochrome c oxidase subunit 1
MSEEDDEPTKERVQGRLETSLANLADEDKKLLKAFVLASIFTLALGVIYALILVLIKAGFLDLEATLAYTILTLHGTTVFYYWLYFVQVAMVMVFVLAYTDGVDRIVWRKLAWLGFGFMAAGFLIDQIAPWMGAIITYGGLAPLSHNMPGSDWFYIGYVSLGIGLGCVSIPCIATPIKAKMDGKVENWSSITFAATLWAVLLTVTSFAALNTFLTQLSVMDGTVVEGFDYIIAYHVMFHNMHYLPLLSTVLVWYCLAEVTTGVKSIFSDRLSKIFFSFYLVVLPPTFLYHMFLDPTISALMKTVASTLAMFISIPTIMVFVIILVSLEASARVANKREGLFAWGRDLPWGNPAFSAIVAACVSAAAGGVLANILIQTKFAALLSDTFAIPAYFHFFTVGTISLTFIGLLLYIVPSLYGRQLWNPKLLAKLPWVLTGGVYLFGVAGIIAGYLGSARRTLTPEYDLHPSIPFLYVLVGIGGLVMAGVLLTYVYALVRTMRSGKEVSSGEVTANMPTVKWEPAEPGAVKAPTATIVMFVALTALFALTWLTFSIVGDLPG